MNKVKKAFQERNSGRVPLYRALSKLGKASREEAKALIIEGKVKVHGVVETNPERMVNPDRAHIEIKGLKALKDLPRLFKFHKPVGYLTTKRDPEGRPTIYDLIPDEMKHFHPVGRLDMHTSGLLLLTNHTKYSNFLTDPKNGIPRTYIVQVRGTVNDHWLQSMVHGVKDKEDWLKFDSATIIKESGKESTWTVVLSEGKNREVRRMFDTLGGEVVKLKRIAYGPYELGDLKPGMVCEVETKFIDSAI